MNVLSLNKVKIRMKENLAGYIFILPIILSLVFFSLFPVVTSLFYSFFDYDIVSAPTNFGLSNYINPFTRDFSGFIGSLKLTFLYTLVSIPLNFILTFGLAMFLNQKSLKGIRVFRVLFYLPCLIPAVVGGLLWQNITEPNYGVANYILQSFGMQPYSWFASNETAIVSLFLVSLFGIGGGTIIWIAQLNGIPESMLESARIDGARFFTRLSKIILPMCSPMIFYSLVMGIIGGLQVFGGVYVLINDANAASLNFFVIGVYNTAFGKNAFGYACAMSWILFVIIAIISSFVFRFSSWVTYGEDM